LGKAPAAVLEAAVAVLVRAAGSLHDPVQGHERRDRETAHGCAPRGRAAPGAPLTSSTKAVARIDIGDRKNPFWPRDPGSGHPIPRPEREGLARPRCG